MPRWFTAAAAVCFLMFVVSPVLIANAPFESTMGLVQKIFYYHMPSAAVFLFAALLCGYQSVRFLISRDRRHDRLAWAAAEVLVLFGAITLVTGPLWARKAWGVWWQWDVRLTSSLMGWMIGVAYLLVRKYGGPGSDKLAAGLALFGMANVPFIYISVNYWRTIHPTTNVVPSLPVSMGVPFWFCFTAFMLLFVLLLKLRVRLEEHRARVDDLYLAVEDR
jgi:heme exporter protein C